MLVKSDIISILNEAMGQVARMRKGGSQATYHCPFCHHAKRKLEICLEDGKDFSKWHCWTCDEKGTYLGSLLNKLKSSDSLRDRLTKLTGDIRISRQKYSGTPTQVALPKEFKSLIKSSNDPEYKNALAYLKRRGVSKEDIIRYNIGYCDDGDYAYHVIVPSYDVDGILNFFIGRRYYNDGMIPYKKADSTMDIVGFEIFLNYNEPINLVEGVFDAFAVRNNVVPLFGKYPSKKLREKMIINKTPRVNMILDEDAMRDSIKNCKMMQQLGIEVRLVKLNGKDPSALGFEKTHELIRNSKEIEFEDIINYELSI